MLMFGLGWAMMFSQSAPLGAKANSTVTESVSYVPSSWSLGGGVSLTSLLQGSACPYGPSLS